MDARGPRAHRRRDRWRMMTDQQLAGETACPTPPRAIPSSFSRRHQLGRVLWGLVYVLTFRPSPKPFHAWRRWLLRLFGAHIASDAAIYPSVKIWAPWNLTMHRLACLAPDVDCYSVAPITLGERATVSQYSYLCAATHD